MLESALRQGALALALVLAFAPAATATLSPSDSIKELRDEVYGLRPQTALPPLAGERGGDGQEASGESGSGSSGQPASGEEAKPSTRPVLMLVSETADETAQEVAETVDPLLGFVGQQVKPVQDAAGSLPTLLAGPTAEAEAEEPAPATATATEVEPDVSVPLLVAGTAAAAAAVAALWLAGSSSSLGAGAAGAAGTGGKLAGTDLRRLLPFASPLFTRFEKDTVLGHPKREALYALILQDPGVSLQSLCDSTGLSRTAVTHHLRLMELQHLIVSKRMGRTRHYYENGGRFGRDQKDAYAVLQNDRSKAVADFVKQNPGAIQKAVCAALGIQASVAHWHLKRLQEATLVEAVRHGRTVSYFPGGGMKGVPLSSAPMAVPAPEPAPQPAPVPLASLSLSV